MENVENIYRLSPMQAGMLFHCLAAPGEPIYIEEYVTQIDGDLDVPALRQAWADVVAAHPALRTAFVWEGLQEPMQIVRRDVSIPWTIVDCRGRATFPPAARARLRRRHRAHGFTLTQAPLMRFVLIHLADRRHLVVWAVHHLLLDGWSGALVRQQVAARYRARRAGRAVVPPPTAPPFAAYVHWIDRQDRQAAERFWRDRLRDATHTPLRFARADDITRTERFARVELLLAEDTTGRIQRTAREHGITLGTLCRAAWALLLARHAGSRDVLFGATLAGRPPELDQVESMIGLFINTVPVRVRMPRRTRVVDWLRHLQLEALDARDYAYASLADVQRWSGVAPGAPLFDSLLVYENYPGGELSAAAADSRATLQMRPLTTFTHTNYPLTLIVRAGDRMEFVIAYDSRTFARDAMSRLLAHVGAALDSLIAHLHDDLSTVSLLTDAERDEVVRTWNAPPDRWQHREDAVLLPDALAWRAIAMPEAIAVVEDDEAVSYRTLHARASQITAALRAIGVDLDVPVAICLEPGIELVAALLGIWNAGGTYVPLDPHAPRDRASYILQDVGAPVLLTDEAHAATFADTPAARIICLDRGLAPCDEEESECHQRALAPDHLAYVLYTSGSTGRPKGVGITHGNLASLMAAADVCASFTSADVWTLFHSPAFDLSVWEMVGALLHGARLVIVPHAMARAPEAFYDLLRREGVTMLTQTPSAFRMWLPVDRAHGGGRLPLRRILFAGEALDAASVRDWAGRHGLSEPTLSNWYGITETTVHVTYHDVGDAELTRGTGIGIGRALPCFQVYVLDARGEPVPVGIPGEIYVGGDGLARGYIGRPDLTAARFVPDPFSGRRGARLYRSGDGAHWRHDGLLDYDGRLDHQVKLRGHRIELGEIEAVLRRESCVRDAVVVLRDDGDRHGDEDGARLIAYVVLDSGDDDEARQAGHLVRALRAQLPEYMVPASIVALAALPLTANGKIDRRQLPAPGGGRPSRDGERYMAPRDAVELELVRLWEQLLDARPIGVRDTFTQLGGHSLLLLRMTAQIERRLGFGLPLDQVVRATTIEQLAARLRARHSGPSSRLVALQPRGDGIPLMAIVPAGGTLACYVALAEHLGEAHPCYACQPRASLDTARIASTIENIAREDVQELRRVRPSGPYALAGWSMGGLVAYEMACQLQDAGEEVCLLALLDTDTPDETQAALDPTDAAVQLMAGQLQLDPSDVAPVAGEDRLDALFTLAQARGRLADEVDVRWTRWLVDGFRTALSATQAYRPRPYPGRLLLIQSGEHASRSRRDAGGWPPLARGGVDLHIVPGTHHTMVEAPHVAMVATLLRTALDRANTATHAR